MTGAMFEPLTDDERASAPETDTAREPDNWRPILPVPEDAPRDFPSVFPKHRNGEPSAWWCYRDAAGRLLGLAVRFDLADGKKDVLPATNCDGPGGRREWRWKAFPAPRPLYGLDRLAARPDAPVLVVEGEKAADAAAALFPDHVAVTSPSGSKAAHMADWTPLQGRHVAVWPDHDAQGVVYAEDAANLAHEAGAAAVAVVQVPADFAAHWDLADPPPDGWDANGLQALLEVAPPWEPGPPDDKTVLCELAALPALEYERRREAEAKRLGIKRVTVLDAEVAKRRPMDGEGGGESGDGFLADPEPWPDPVNGAALLDAIAGAFERYVVLPDGGAEALVLWTLHAHGHEAAQVSPVLCLTSPVMECGKSTCLTIVQVLTPRALPTANITAAALFRAVEKWRPTVLIDEVDTFLRNNDELRGVLNSGHARASAFVVRTVGEDHEPKHFCTWAPKAVALIGALPDTLAGRSIAVRLRRKRPDEIVERLRLDRMGAFAALSRQAARWAADNLDALREADPDVPAELHNRVADNWRPLIAIADRTGGDWPARARATARALSADGEDEGSAAVMLLADIRALFEARGAERIASADLAEALAAMEDRPWPEWRKGRTITVRQIARLLSPFGIAPGTIRAADGSTPKGYRKSAFKDAFARYLPIRSATPPQPAGNPGFSVNLIRHKTENVADEKPPKAKESTTCGSVADGNPGTREEEAMNPPRDGDWSVEL